MSTVLMEEGETLNCLGLKLSVGEKERQDKENKVLMAPIAVLTSPSIISLETC